MLSTLFRAMINGVLFAFKIFNTSEVWGFIPSLMSITKIAMSARLPPLFRKFVNAAWPGVSMNKKPGSSRGIWNFSRISPARFWIVSFFISVNEIFWVIPPASVSWIFVPRILSRIEVFPWSTCPAIVTIGWRIFSV